MDTEGSVDFGTRGVCDHLLQPNSSPNRRFGSISGANFCDRDGGCSSVTGRRPTRENVCAEAMLVVLTK
jgi:hypothetical protein